MTVLQTNTNTSTASTKELKRVLGRFELMSISVGQIIGAGIMALTGIAIGMTGKSVPISFMISAIFKLFIAIPVAIIGGTIRMRGGTYTQVALLAGKELAPFFRLALTVGFQNG